MRTQRWRQSLVTSPMVPTPEVTPPLPALWGHAMLNAPSVWAVLLLLLYCTVLNHYTVLFSRVEKVLL